MKNTLLFFLILFFNISVAQRKNINVQYSVQIYDEEIMKNIDPEFRKMFESAISTAHLLSYNLVITDKGSKFCEDTFIPISDTDKFMKSSTLFSGYMGITYQYLGNLYFEKKNSGNDLMVKEPLKSNWKLYDETKMIDNYLCYKATNVNVVYNRSGKIFNHPVIAWYCPKLPYNYGPNGYSNLPGLILELQVRNVVFGAKKIDLNSALDFDFDFLKNVKTISRNELDKKIDDEMQLLKG